MRLLALFVALSICGLGSVGCGASLPPLSDVDMPRRDRVERLLQVIASDSMEGRGTGTPGSERASAFLAAELERYGVLPAADDGFFQDLVLVRPPGVFQARAASLSEGADPDTIAPEALIRDRNVIGIIPGNDPELSREVIVIGAHFDHLGIGPSVDGDSIYNGADDDASGTVAILEIARVLAQGEGPGRTVLVLLTTAEEMGVVGTRWFVDHPTIDFERIVADLQVEMIGRPDALAGGFGRSWLTGYERSTMGNILSENGIPIVPDARPQQGFFGRSDNIVFAREGIPAHTLSSFNLHSDYHRPSDEVDQVDLDHMTEVIDAATAMVLELSWGARPEWHPGGRPEGPGGP